MADYYIPTGLPTLSYGMCSYIMGRQNRLEAEAKAGRKLTYEKVFNVNTRLKYVPVYLNEHMYETIMKLEEHVKDIGAYDKKMARFIVKAKAEMTFYQRMLTKSMTITNEELSDFIDILTEQQGRHIDIFLYSIQKEWMDAGITGDLNITCSYLELINVISNVVDHIVTNYRNATFTTHGFHDNALDFLVTPKTRDLSERLLNLLPGKVDKHVSSASLKAFDIILMHLYDENKYQKALDTFKERRSENVQGNNIVASKS